jgi:dephospho-CoA kinase
VKINRYIQRVAVDEPLTPQRRSELEAEARRRLARQIADDEKIPLSDFVLVNDGNLEELEEQIDELWPMFQFASANTTL